MAPTRNSLASFFPSSKPSATRRTGKQASVNGAKVVKSLRKPSQKELIEIEAATEQTKILPSNQTRSSPTNLPPSNSPQRPNTPPPHTTTRICTSPSRPSLLGTPATHRRGSPLKRSPVAVREDPDTGKLYLMLAPGALSKLDSSPGEAKTSPTLLKRKRAASPPLSPTPEAGSPLAKRMRVVSAASPLKTPARQTTDSKRFLVEDEEEIVEDSEGLTLRPGRTAGTRVSLGSPKEFSAAQSSPKILQTVRKVEVFSDEELIITPKSVRERPKRRTTTAHPTPTRAVFGAPGRSPARSSLSSKTPASPTPASPESDVPIAADFAVVSVPTLIPSVRYGLSCDLPLPPHYASILTLHNAIENTVIVHLATNGTSTSTFTSTEEASVDAAGRTATHCSLLHLISYDELRPIVERSCARRLGEQELARLVWAWSATISEVDEKRRGSERSGLGFIVSRMRGRDARTGRKTWIWSLGLELTMRQAKRESTPPIDISFGGASSTLSSPSAASRSAADDSSFSDRAPPARSSMSFVSYWNSGLDARKREMGHRLRSLVASHHDAWARQDDLARTGQGNNKESLLATPTKSRTVEFGAGDLPTPAATREEGHRIGSRTVRFDLGELDGDTDGEAGPNNPSSRNPSMASSNSPRPDRTKKGLSAEWKLPTSSSDTLYNWNPSYDLRAVPPIPLAILPSLKEDVRPDSAPRPDVWARFAAGQKAAAAAVAAASAAEPRTPSTSASKRDDTAGRAMSLRERIAAKEEAKRAGLLKVQQERGLRGLGDGAKGSRDAQVNVMSGFKRRATLSRLPDVADAVYMLFSVAGTPTTVRTAVTSIKSKAEDDGEGAVSIKQPTSPSSNALTTRSPILSMSDVLASIRKSLSVALSAAEARDALDLLRSLAPGFLGVSVVGAREWVTLGGATETSKGAKGDAVTRGNPIPFMSLREVRRRIAVELKGGGCA